MVHKGRTRVWRGSQVVWKNCQLILKWCVSGLSTASDYYLP